MMAATDETPTTDVAVDIAGGTVRAGSIEVRATMPDVDIKRSLEMGDGEPCLVVSRRTWAHGRPVSFARLYHPGSRFELSGHYVPPGTEAFSRAAEESNE